MRWVRVTSKSRFARTQVMIGHFPAQRISAIRVFCQVEQCRLPLPSRPSALLGANSQFSLPSAIPPHQASPTALLCVYMLQGSFGVSTSAPQVGTANPHDGQVF